jgi:hypothetical protein
MPWPLVTQDDVPPAGKPGECFWCPRGWLGDLPTLQQAGHAPQGRLTARLALDRLPPSVPGLPTNL